MNNEIKNVILSSKENIGAAMGIILANPKKIICEEFFIQIKSKLEMEFKFEYYNNNEIGIKKTGIYFSKKENEDKMCLLYFGSDYDDLEIGVTNEDDSWKEKKEKGFYSFNSINWENILDPENIENAVKEIKEYIENLK